MVYLSSCILFVMFFLSGWSSWVFSMAFALFLSVFLFNASFSSCQDLMFSYSNISMLMVFLSCILCYLSLISSWESKEMSFCTNLMSLSLVLVLAFSLSNVLGFYVFFEISLIPTLILIIGWGYQPERLQAGSYMMLYTVTASLPLLVLILYSGGIGGSWDFDILSRVSYLYKGMILLCVYGAFLVKLPMYGVHLWLPKAHVEAPLAGSMILAGILLKLGGFGLFQMKFCLSLFVDSFSIIVVAASLWGGMIASLMCMRQMDVKSFVAYSSVGHMSIVVAGFILGSSWGIMSALITMLAHGFSSSALFCLAYFSYKKSYTRNIPFMKGLLQVFPSLSLYWFVFCCINMACPPTLNLMGELMVVPILWSSSVLLALIMGLMVFLSAAYNMYLYSSINHGSFTNYVFPSSGMPSSSLSSLLFHLIPLILIMKSDLFNFF